MNVKRNSKLLREQQGKDLLVSEADTAGRKHTMADTNEQHAATPLHHNVPDEQAATVPSLCLI